MRRPLFAAVLPLLLLVACGDDDDELVDARVDEEAVELSTSLEYEGDTEGFYEVPDPLPTGDHGDLIRYQVVDEVDVAGTVWRVMYLSESVQGDPIAVTGLVAAPTGEAPDTGRPVLSWAHGTTGIADACAPSKTVDQLLVSFAEEFLAKGWVLAATDFEGLGTPGRHPYIAGISEGRGTLDIVTAAGQLDAAEAVTTTVVWGHSQGGHAALFASELAAEWAPDLDVVGTVAGAPPSELPLIAGALRDGPFAGYLAMAAAGINAAYPEAKLEDVLTPKALDELDAVDEVCVTELHEQFSQIPYDEFAAADFNEVPEWKQALEVNNPGTVATDIPLLIIHGEADAQIPPLASELLFKRLCGLGQVAERRTYPGAGHADVIQPSFADMVTWMEARVAGDEPTNGCPAT